MQNHIAQRFGLFVLTTLALLSCQRESLDASAEPQSVQLKRGSSCASGVTGMWWTHS